MQQFFEENEIVISSYFSAPLIPSGIWNNKYLPKLKFKISKKLYVWISLIKDKKIIFDKFYTSNQTFPLNKILKNTSKLKKEIEKFNTNLNYWIKINCFSEIPRWYWLWFSGTFAANLALNLFLINKKINVNDISKITQNKLFDKIYQLAYQFEKILKYSNTNWENSRITFEKDRWPFLFWREKENLEDYKIEKLSIETDIDNIFDIFIITSGIPSDTTNVEKNIQSDKKLFEQMSTIQKFKENEVISSALKENYKILEKTFILTNIQLINLLEQLDKKPFNPHIAEKFIETLKWQKVILEISWDTSYFAKLLEKLFYQNSSSFYEYIWITPLRWWRFGWGYLVILPKNIWFNTLKKAIKQIKDFYPNTEIIYRNQKDNISTYELKIEQFIDENIIWNWFDKNVYIFEDIQLWLRKLISNPEDILKNFDVVLDIDKWKVYIKGQKLTSKQIHSQSKLVEILYYCLYKPKTRIKNTEFIPSSYTKNKSEFTGKIIYPFINLIKKYLNKEMVFSLQESFTGFEVYFDPKKVKFWILEKY